MSRADIRAENHGSIFLVRGATEAGTRWLADTAPADAQWFGWAMAVEPRYVLDVLEEARKAGLEVA